MFNVNARSALYGMQAVYPYFKDREVIMCEWCLLVIMPVTFFSRSARPIGWTHTYIYIQTTQNNNTTITQAGHIINISSVLGRLPFPTYRSTYCARSVVEAEKIKRWGGWVDSGWG